MPEGDTVWRTAHHLNEALAGRVLTSTEFRVPRYATVDLTGEVLREVVSVGKHLLMRTDEHSVHSHLKMEGSWHLYRPATLRRGGLGRPAHTVRAILRTDEWVAVGFSLGIIEVLPRADEASAVGHLGPDVLDPLFDRDLALANLRRDPEVPVFVALHDQRKVAGFGNEFVNETLYLSAVDPRTPVGEVDIERILDRGVKLIRANRDRIERSFTGSLRPGELHWVFSRSGRPCRRCGALIGETALGPPTQERRVYFCPTCQPPASGGPDV
ncbi:Fpg/Nei family DNA glycosylase [Aeromicrobium sp. 636]|uniref:DNA-(apurinic or apyrimidinic site) lyase n=1 Tax=Aeromicrobium senzhongii TaxID=2663859 RepID=A0A8I0ETX2_9ACTN|nr:MULTISPECIES: DNA-formamidopyrimidine glycosylase family protein [Aeromicrobium]MBC9226366.1 Fpg/Nei family DNA glycosylase [Aeromicrobium senzhongii]MCQ3998471.1 Fpg/Nei family DNA glycosylase [Aeromicrobium sp. 636]